MLVAEFLSEAEERELLDRMAGLTFDPIVMRGQVARRRALHYGVGYGYQDRAVTPAPAMPDWLTSMRAGAASLAQLAPDDLAEILVSQYQVGATIGWHRDAPMFGPVVIGVSLGAACRLRFRRSLAAEQQAFEIELPPRSLYLLGGAARASWQHSIPPVKGLRYSVTFRTVRARWRANPAGQTLAACEP